ncbi:MAG: hypothetical protein Kow0090_05920 [Myxococcota bacterium]
MRLSEIKKVLNHIEIANDCEFETLGILRYRKNKMLSFIMSDRFLSELKTNDTVCAVFCTKELAPSLKNDYGLVISETPQKDFYTFHNCLVKETEFYRKREPNQIDPSAKIHPSAVIGEYSVKIAKNVLIEPNVVIMPNTTIEDDVILRAGVIIGTQGFEFKRLGVEMLPVDHGGGVHLHKRVELQALTHVAKSIFGEDTTVGEDSKTDALVHIAHNVKIGERCRFAANAMIAGSATIEDDVWVGPSASISAFVIVGKGANVTIGSVVTKDVAPGERVTGNFAIKHERFIEFIRKIR